MKEVGQISRLTPLRARLRARYRARLCARCRARLRARCRGVRRACRRACRRVVIWKVLFFDWRKKLKGEASFHLLGEHFRPTSFQDFVSRYLTGSNYFKEPLASLLLYFINVFKVKKTIVHFFCGF